LQDVLHDIRVVRPRKGGVSPTTMTQTPRQNDTA